MARIRSYAVGWRAFSGISKNDAGASSGESPETAGFQPAIDMDAPERSS